MYSKSNIWYGSENSEHPVNVQIKSYVRMGTGPISTIANGVAYAFSQTM